MASSNSDEVVCTLGDGRESGPHQTGDETLATKVAIVPLAGLVGATPPVAGHRQPVRWIHDP